MLRNKALLSVLLSFAVLLLATTGGQAQRYRARYYGPGYYYPNYRYYGPRYIYPYYWYGAPYAVPAYPYYYVPPTTYYAPPSTYYVPPSSYYTPPPAYTVPSAKPTTGDAVVRVLVPDPQATIWFDGQPTSLTGTERVFRTPRLTPGGTYEYVVRATWTQAGRAVTQERTVFVTPDQTTVVDFRQASGQALPPPPSTGT